MSDDNLPNLTETEITDLWRFRQEHKDSEVFHSARRRHADQEVLRRGKERDAQILGTDAGDITITYPSQYAYNAGKVDGEFFQLIERDGLSAEWNQFATHQYKIDRRWLNRLMKRGQEYRDAIEDMTIGTSGSPSLDGPSLADLGGYATEAPQEVPLP